MNEITFKSKWFERCVRDYLELDDEPITKEALSEIKYLAVGTTNGHSVQFGKGCLPSVFYFSDAGDEWYFNCISDTGRFKNIEDFIEIDQGYGQKSLEIKEDLVDDEEKSSSYFDSDADMSEFNKSIKEYWAEQSDYDELRHNDDYDEDAFDDGMVFIEDFSHFYNLEVVRLMSCELDIHSLSFLEEYSKLRVLEIGEVDLDDLKGIDKLIGLEKLSIWSN